MAIEMVSQEDITRELKNHPNGILQTELARKLRCVNKKGEYSNSFHNPLLSLLKKKEIRREISKKRRFIVFLNEEKNKESDKI